MALTRWPVLLGCTDFRRILHDLSWAFARSPGPRSLACERLACFWQLTQDAPYSCSGQVVGGSPAALPMSTKSFLRLPKTSSTSVTCTSARDG